MYSPNSKITLLNTPLTMDGEHQIQFSGTTEQESYFKSCPSLNIFDSKFQRKDGSIRIGLNIDKLYKYNYVMYQNTQFTNKWFYAYIERMEYVGELVTNVFIKTDVFQTWFFDLTFNKSFIDRQHTSYDDYNTINDTVAHGQLVESKSKSLNFTGGYFVFCSSDVSADDVSESPAYEFSIGDYSVPCCVLFWTEAQSNMMSTTLQTISNMGRGDRILSAIYVPYIPNLGGIILDELNADVGQLHICRGFGSASNLKGTIDFDFSKTITWKKELTFPYAKIVVTDMTTGQSIELAPEKFDDTDIEFEVQVSISETPCYRIIPKNYDGQSLAFNEALVVKCSTSLPVANNVYAKYMMMNGDMNNLKKAFAGIGIAGALAGKSPMGVITGLEEITTITAQENQASKMGNQVSAIVDGAMERINYNNGIKISLFTMDSFHLEQARNYWTMFGYPLHSMATPSLNGGQKFNFVKMVSPNIEGGNVPQEDMMEIEKIFTKGVTLWHSSTTYKKY